MAERKPDSVISLESTAAALRLLCGEFKPWGNGMLVTFEDVNYALSWRRELRATIENLSGIADRLAALERVVAAASRAAEWSGPWPDLAACRALLAELVEEERTAYSGGVRATAAMDAALQWLAQHPEAGNDAR